MPTLVLSEAERSRRDKVVAQLAADNENTVLIAMTMLKKMAAAHKVPVYEYLLGSPAGLSAYREVEEARQRAQRAEADAREATARAERAERAARQSTASPPPNAAVPETWRADLKNALNHHVRRRRFLSGWQEGFVTDLLARGQRRLSGKQAVKVSEVLEHFNTLPKVDTQHEDWEDEP
jgi:hypothetical protein